MKKNRLLLKIFLPALLLTLFTSCNKEDIVESGDEIAVVHSADNSRLSGGTGEKKLETDLLKSVRSATSRFHSTKQAIKAGYTPDDHCVAHPRLGGMGYHWVNRDLVDAVFDPLKPEVLLYATGPGGNLRLVAVEYLVAKSALPRPMFGTHLFDDGGAPLPFPHWSLHVWVHEENPAGIFTPFNPNITCP